MCTDSKTRGCTPLQKKNIIGKNKNAKIGDNMNLSGVIKFNTYFKPSAKTKWAI
jgi:hypothetical protein